MCRLSGVKSTNKFFFLQRFSKDLKSGSATCFHQKMAQKASHKQSTQTQFECEFISIWLGCFLLSNNPPIKNNNNNIKKNIGATILILLNVANLPPIHSAVCPNPFLLPDDFQNEDRPSRAKSITVQDISKNFRSGTEEMEQYTCLRISAGIDPYSASKVKGIQLSILGKDMPDLNKLLCFSMNFSSGLEYNSVKKHFITSECFCGLRPGRPYQVVAELTKLMMPDVTRVKKHSGSQTAF